MAQYDELAGWYDPLYAATGKDHAAEAAAVLSIASGLGVVPASVLDVACGTGQHLAAFREAAEDVVGIDSAPAMLEVARRRLPDDVVLRHGDMRRFDLDRTFDLVTCLFSSIGHVRDEADLDAAVAAMARHVAPGGLLVVEPWLTPEGVLPEAEDGGTHHSLESAITDDGVAARVSRSQRRGDVLVLSFAWAVSEAAGVRTFEETFRMPLFTQERYLRAVTSAGLEASWTTSGAMKAHRGLLLGRRPVAD